MNKDGITSSGLNGRKASMNQGQGTPSGLRNDRPGPRRRDTSDSIGGGLGASPFNRRDESNTTTPTSALLHRRADLKDGNLSSLLDKSARLDGGIDTGSPFSSWKRNVSGPMSAGLTGPLSPWAAAAPQSAGFGAFGNFSYDGPSAAPATPGEKRPGFGSLRGESRFKGLMSKESSEDIGVKSRDRSASGLGNLAESFVEKHGDAGLETHEEERIGSAALLDDNVSSLVAPNSEKKQFDDIGFASFGAPSHLLGGRTGHDPLGLANNDTMSLTGTTSHRIPDSDNRFISGNADEGLGNVGSFNSRMQISRQQMNSGFDGSGENLQGSFVGPQRNFPPISGLGSIGGLSGPSPWSTAAPGGFNQQRTAQAFGSGIFSSMDDISSPGGAFGTPTNSAFPSTRSKMGALFAEHVREDSNDVEDAFSSRLAGAGLNYPFNLSETQTSAQTRNMLDDLFARRNSNENQQQSSGHGVSTSGTHPSSSSGPSPQYGRSPEPSQPPPAQQRQMVMPDRIRWIYRDPSGNMQGPFTGLEMHDWYKAGFFSPELQVKKVEEKDYEPLAQLIRRIGNSREPFLVPQIGIPHGPPSSTGVLGTPGGNASLGIQPPFGNSFPSFGTTLTADQQNALERRKQEEQILMARQKEHLQQQQQSMMRNMLPTMPFPGPQPLHHQASGQSLHSHPSYSNISAPGGFPNQPPLSNQSAFDRQGFGALAGDGTFPRDTGLPSSLERANLGHSSAVQPPYGAVPQDFGHSQQVSNMLQDRARLQAQQDQWNAMQKNDGTQNLERLEQFHQLRLAENEQILPPSEPIVPSRTQETSPEPLQYEQPIEIEQQTRVDKDLIDENVWREFAPQPSQSPLPAPAAQRNRQHVAEALAAESSPPQSPVETPGTTNLAPWARDAQSSKVPSFQEIQEAEVRKAVQQEEVAAAARRQLAEQERIIALQAAAAAAQSAVAGLPSSANWATGSPASTTPGSPWAKPAAGKVGTPTGLTKTKTLAQIQKEEESRKQRAAMVAAAANVTASPVATPGGKSYANLAGKVAAPTGNPTVTGNGAWNVVGAGGKTKAPASPAVPVTIRTVSSGVVPSSGKVKPQPARNNSVANATQLATDAFQKWVRNSLAGGLNGSINVDEFVKNLISYPLEEEIISDAIYGNSQTLDGNRFAREFIQRKKEADKGKVSDTIASNFSMGGGDIKSSTGGWNEVAKKAPVPTREEPASNFKVVAAKKKGKR